MQDDILKIMFKDIKGWRACELDDGVGLSKAAALRELPYKLDPKRAPYAKKLYWDESVLTAVITPTKDVIAPSWIQYNVEPIIIMAAPASMIDPEQSSFVTANYKHVGRLNDGDEETGNVYHYSREDEGVNAHNIIVILDDRDIHVSFAFSASDAASDKEICDIVLEPLVKIATNFRESATLDILSAANRAARSAANLAFEFSLSGSFVPEGAESVYPLKGLSEGWKLYAHNGNEAIMSMLTMEDELDSPSGLVYKSRNKIFEISKDETGNAAFGWRDDGIQFFLVPPVDGEPTGFTPLLLTVHISNDSVIHAPSKNYEVIHSDGDIEGGVEVLAFGPVDSVISVDINRFDHSYVAMFNSFNCSISAICVSSSDQENKFYDEAIITVAKNIAEHVNRIYEAEDNE